ncbi:MAG: signal peptide peptidase SppA [Paracoccaceae bacterium]
MSFEQNYYEERRRKWRRSAFWRGVLVTLGVLGALVFWAVNFTDDRPSGPHIARFYISDVIYDDPERDAILAEMADNADVQAVILRINSPGGTTVGSEVLFESIRNISARKPVVAVLGEVAASGGYIAAIAADHVIARGNTITGSIGVIMEYPDVTGLMETIGIEMQTIRSSDIKGGISPFRAPTLAEQAENQAMVEEAYVWFRTLVQERRGLTEKALDSVASGGVFSGRRAVENDLIDALGGEPAAVTYLESVDITLRNVTIETWSLKTKETGLLNFLGVKLGINPLLNSLSGRNGPRLYSLKR